MQKRQIRTLDEVARQGSLLTIPEVAAALTLSTPTVYSLIRQGKLPIIQLGRYAKRVCPKDLKNFIQDNKAVLQPVPLRRPRAG